MSSERKQTEMVASQASAVGSDYDAAGKSVDEIESDISETRAELGSILHEIEREIAPQHLLQRAIDSLRDGMDGGMGRRIGGTLRDNPTALVLMGVGLGWFALSASRRSRPGEYRGAAPDRVSAKVEAAGDGAAPVVTPPPEKVSVIAGEHAFPASEAPVAYPVDAAFAGGKPGEAMAEKEHIAAGMSEAGKDKPLPE